MKRVVLWATTEQLRVILPLIISEVSDFEVTDASALQAAPSRFGDYAPQRPAESLLATGLRHLAAAAEERAPAPSLEPLEPRQNAAPRPIDKPGRSMRAADVIVQAFATKKRLILTVAELREVLEAYGFSPTSVYTTLTAMKKRGDILHINGQRYRLPAAVAAPEPVETKEEEVEPAPPAVDAAPEAAPLPEPEPAPAVDAQAVDVLQIREDAPARAIMRQHRDYQQRRAEDVILHAFIEKDQKIMSAGDLAAACMNAGFSKNTGYTTLTKMKARKVIVALNGNRYRLPKIEEMSVV